MPDPLPRLRRLCLRLPHSVEREAWGSPTFRVERGKMFAMYASAAQPNGRGRPQVWVNCSKVDQEFLVAEFPSRHFVPPYVGPSGWVGVWLDGKVDWTALSALLADGWRRAAPKAVLVAHDATAPTPRTSRRR